MIKASILGATGYAGQELVRMLYQHGGVEPAALGTQNYAGQKFSEIYPHFKGIVDTVCRSIDDDGLLKEADVIFLALPHGLSVPYVEKAVKWGKKVIDLGADFRLKSLDIYRLWYKASGPQPELLNLAVYGLPELRREKIKKAQIVANPGCYPTTVILALAPLLQQKLINTEYIIIDSKSGVSGAGRSLVTASLYSEAEGGLKAYGFPQHRHTPEIEQELSLLAAEDIKVSFTPHLVPMIRGMLSTIYTKPLPGVSPERLMQACRDYYTAEPFIRLMEQGRYPQTKWVLGTNYCDLGLSWDGRTQTLKIISAIDNLVKGAAGQAIQNMNIMFGFNEETG